MRVQCWTQTCVCDLTRRDSRFYFFSQRSCEHEQATNKLLYAAIMDLNTPGQYRAEISVETKKENALVTGNLEVAGPEPPLLAHWPYFVALPMVACCLSLTSAEAAKARCESAITAMAALRPLMAITLPPG